MGTELEHPHTAVPNREAPSNLEAEQAVLGAVMANNEAMNHVGESLMPEDFYAGVHQKIFKAVLEFRDKGKIANPVTLKHHFTGTEGIEDQYLARLVGAATSIINIHDYTRVIRDLALKRRLMDIGSAIVSEALNPQSEHGAIGQVELAEQQLFKLAFDGHSAPSNISVKQSLASVLIRAEHAYKRSGEVIGLTTGFAGLDQVLGGLHPSDLVIIAGRPSMGKTALATNIAYCAARRLQKEDAGKQARSVGFFSLEMSADQLSMRLLSSEASISSQSIQNGRLNATQWEKLTDSKRVIESIPLRIDDAPALTIGALRTRARRMKRSNNLALMVVDYLQLLRATPGKGQGNRVQEVSEITQGLKAIAKELDIPVIALSQLSRAVESREDKRPQLADLRESGSIEQDADIVMFVYREEYYLQRTEPQSGSASYERWAEQMEKSKGVAEVIVAKHRNGPTAIIPMQFESYSTRFGDIEPRSFVP